MNLSRKKSYKHDSVDRIIQLSSLFDSQRKFLETCNINNHSYISDLKHGKIERPGPDYLEKIIRGTQCDGTWLLTGEGEMFPDKNSVVADEDVNYQQSFSYALRLIERIEQRPDAIKEMPLPEGIEIQLAELLLKLLKRHEDN